MCYLTYGKRSPLFIEPEDFRHIADEVFPHTRTLVLSWATEPLLHPRFGELLAITAEHRVPEVLFVTNGTLLNPEISEAVIEKGVHKVVVSMEGANAETYEEIRQGASFEGVLQNLASFAEARESRGSRLPKLQFNYLLMRSTVAQLPGFVRLVARYRPAEINAWFMDLQAHAPMEHELIDASDRDFRDMVPAARAAAKGEGITLYLPYVSPEKASRLGRRLRRAWWSSSKIINKLRHRSPRAS
jgi:MoaA/NifB/PqqE/SkfB family radical SAM enzyme